MKRSTSRSGFALLMVLVLVLVAGVALAGLASRSMERAVQAKSDIEEVQRKWAVTSARSTLLERAGLLLHEAERKDPDATERGERDEAPFYRPLRRIELRTELAGLDYRFVVSDEQTKANVNTLIDRLGRADAQRVIADLLRDRVGSPAAAAARVRFRTYEMRGASDEESSHAAIVGYSQAFEQVTPELLLPQDPDRGLAGSVTCWGSGQLNFHRTPDEILEAVFAKDIRRSTVRRLLEAREDQPRLALDDALARIDRLDEDEKREIRRHLTDASRTFSLWIVARNGQRSWHRLAVRGTRSGVPQPSDADSDPAASANPSGTMTAPLFFSW